MCETPWCSAYAVTRFEGHDLCAECAHSFAVSLGLVEPSYLTLAGRQKNG